MLMTLYPESREREREREGESERDGQIFRQRDGFEVVSAEACF